MDTTEREETEEAQRRWELLAIKSTHTRVMIGARARDARREMGLTQNELGAKMRAVGYSTWVPAKVGNLEHGEYMLKLDEAWTLSLLLGRELADFLPPLKLTPGLHPRRP